MVPTPPTSDNVKTVNSEMFLMIPDLLVHRYTKQTWFSCFDRALGDLEFVALSLAFTVDSPGRGSELIRWKYTLTVPYLVLVYS